MSNKFYKIGALILLAALLGISAFFVWKKNTIPKEPTLEEAAKMGEIATHKLLIQIENPKGKAEDLAGRYERGDIVLVFPAGHEFSRAEKEGFLILRMDLTPKQAEILARFKEEEKSFWEKMQSKSEPSKQLKRRKFTVDLQKIGIGPEEQKGREIEDRIFEWDIITEKK